MENKTFLEKLKFGIGDGNLQYYLYNWKCPSMGSEKVHFLGKILFVMVISEPQGVCRLALNIVSLEKKRPKKLLQSLTSFTQVLNFNFLSFAPGGDVSQKQFASYRELLHTIEGLLGQWTGGCSILLVEFRSEPSDLSRQQQLASS